MPWCSPAGSGQNWRRSARGGLDRLCCLGVTLDDAANERSDTVISTSDCRVRALVIKTDEERMIARHTLDVAGLAQRSRAA
jgi:acetate kinase